MDKVGSQGLEPDITINSLTASDLSNSTFPAGHIIKVQGYTNSTRAVIGTTADELLWSGISYTKLYDSTNLIMVGHLQKRGGWYYAIRYRVVLTNSGNSSTTNYDGYIGHTDTATSGTNSDYFARAEPIDMFITDQVAGNISIEIRSQNENGSAVQAGQFNPNTSDDARWPQTKSTLVIYEIMT